MFDLIATRSHPAVAWCEQFLSVESFQADHMSEYIIFIILALNTIFGVGILLRNSKKETNRLYALFVLTGNLWILSNYLENEPGLVGIEALEFILRVDFFSAIAAFYYWFRFVSVFADCQLGVSQMRALRFGLFAWMLGVASTAFIDSILVANVHFTDGVISFTNGPFSPIYAATLAFYLLAGITVLFVGRRRALLRGDTTLIHHIDLILMGSALSLSVALVINLIQVYMVIPLDISRVGLYSMSFMVIFTAYALVRERFFEMRLVLLRSVLFLTFAVLMANIAIFLIVVFTSRVLGIPVDHRTLVVSIVVATIIALLFDTLRKLFERVTDKIFFRGRYSSEIVMKRITQAIVAKLGLSEMAEEILSIFKEEFRIEKAGLLLFDKMTNDTWIPAGFPEDLPADSRMILRTSTNTFCVSTDELPLGSLKEVMVQHEIASILLIKNKETPIALLLLGPKRSGEPLHDEDIAFLEVLAGELAIGIQNAQTFSMIWQFNRKLEEKVKERTQELQQAQEKELAQAHEVLHLKDEFVFLAAHELRTPITAIRGFLELSEEYIAQAPEDIRENMTAVKETSAHLNQLINDLLEIARSESGAISIAVSPHPFLPILDRVTQSVVALLQEKDLKLETYIAPLPAILCDETKLREVLLNLVSNAIKYNREGGTITINVFLNEARSQMICEVKDTGFGIPKDQQDRIFQKFFRASTPGTEGVIGTGLGLFLTRMLVEKMGGSISFTSVEGEGTTFFFSLPTAAER